MAQDQYQTSMRPSHPRRQRATIALTVLTTVALIAAARYSYDETASTTTSASTSKPATTSPACAGDAAPRPLFTRPQWDITPEVLDRFFHANPTSFQAPVWAVNRDRAWQGYQIAVQRHGCRLHAAGR